MLEQAREVIAGVNRSVPIKVNGGPAQGRRLCVSSSVGIKPLVLTRGYRKLLCSGFSSCFGCWLLGAGRCSWC
jgi:hypothetical protein